MRELLSGFERSDGSSDSGDDLPGAIFVSLHPTGQAFSAKAAQSDKR